MSQFSSRSPRGPRPPPGRPARDTTPSPTFAQNSMVDNTAITTTDVNTRFPSVEDDKNDTSTLLFLEENVASTSPTFATVNPPPFARKSSISHSSRSASMSSTSSHPNVPQLNTIAQLLHTSMASPAAPTPDPWTSQPLSNSAEKPQSEPSTEILDQKESAQPPAIYQLASSPSPTPDTLLVPTSAKDQTDKPCEERVRLRVDEMIEAELERLNLEERTHHEDVQELLQEASENPITRPRSPPFVTAASIKSSLSSLSNIGSNSKGVGYSESGSYGSGSIESITMSTSLSESTTWEKVDKGTRGEEWQDIRNPKEDVFALSESENEDFDDDDEEDWEACRKVQFMGGEDGSGFIPSVERRRNLNTAGTATPKGKRTPTTSMVNQHAWHGQTSQSQQQPPLPTKAFTASLAAKHQQPTPPTPTAPTLYANQRPIVPIPQAKLTPEQEQLVAQLQKARSGKGIPVHARSAISGSSRTHGIEESMKYRYPVTSGRLTSDW